MKSPRSSNDKFKDKLEDTRKAHQALQQAVKDLDKEFAGARLDQSQYDALQRELAESEREAKDAEKAFKDCSSGLDELGRKAGAVSDKAGKVAEAFAPVTAAVGALAGAALATVPATEELRGDLSMLENNAGRPGWAWMPCSRPSWTSMLCPGRPTAASRPSPTCSRQALRSPTSSRRWRAWPTRPLPSRTP